MSAQTSIEWTDRTWNPVRGCSIVSPGCVNCYAMKFAHRFSGPGGHYQGLTKLSAAGPTWSGTVRTVPAALGEPLAWRKPQRIFVNSMSDLFHADVPNEFIAAVFGIAALAPRHTFQILTKRPERMRDWFLWLELNRPKWAQVTPKQHWQALVVADAAASALGRKLDVDAVPDAWPLPNVWLGASVEDQRRADERVPALLQAQAAVRFLSCEPLLGPVDLQRVWLTGRHYAPRDEFEAQKPAGPRISWIIAGGESGPGARPCALEWLERIVKQCRDAGVAAFVKQLGAVSVSEARTCPPNLWTGDPKKLRREDYAPDGSIWAWRAGLHDPKGGDIEEFPEELRVREFPEEAPNE